MDRVLQVCSVLTLGGNGINSGSFARWRKVPSPPQNVFTGRRSVAIVDGVAYFVLSMAFIHRGTPGHYTGQGLL
ncbi:Os07g0242166 [Oryza sativa Japonica Group]|nr:Os07g0242166 [Oryza sativa Japonica Group]